MTVNCKVVLREVKHHPGATEEEKKRDLKDAFEGMLGAFRTKLSDCKVLNEYRRRQFYESKGEKRRRKIKENRGKKFKDS
jgi:ribosomal protein S21